MSEFSFDVLFQGIQSKKMNNLPPEIIYIIVVHIQDSCFEPWDRTSYQIWLSPLHRSYRLYFSSAFLQLMSDMDWNKEPVYEYLLWISRDWTHIDIKEELKMIHKIAYERNFHNIARMMLDQCPMAVYYDSILRFDGEEDLKKAMKRRDIHELGFCPLDDDLGHVIKSEEYGVAKIMLQYALDTAEQKMKFDHSSLKRQLQIIIELCEETDQIEIIELSIRLDPYLERAEILYEEWNIKRMAMVEW